MTAKRLFCFFLVILLLVGCTPSIPGSTPSWTTSPPGDDEPTESESVIFEQLFDLENKITISLHMERSELAKLQEDYNHYSSFGSKSPIYRMADLEITIETAEKSTTYTIEQVGVRMKGNTSRNDFYSAQDGIYNLVHLKISFQETFDDPEYYGSDALEWTDADRKARKERTFATLSKLDMKWNRCYDSSYLKEHYAYEIYRSYGILTPHTNLASVNWSGLHMGVYTIYEPVDKTFLKKNLPEEQLGGDLYKLGWTSSGASFTSLSSIGIENEDSGEFYTYDLKTNKKTSTHEALTALITRLNSGLVTKSDLAELVDMDAFLRYAAISYLLGNPDDLRNNYNNCYIYFRGDTGQLLLIPYDCDRCLGVTRHWNPTGDGVTSDDPFSTVMASGIGTQENPLFLYTVCTGGYYVKEFAQVLSDTVDSPWFDADFFRQQVALVKQHYENDTQPGKQFSNASGYSFQIDADRTSDFSAQDNISFAEYMQAKTKTLKKYLKNLDDYLTGTPAVPARYYIRADFTDWEVRDGWELSGNENGQWQIILSVEHTVQWKIYDRTLQKWFGSEVLDPDTDVIWDTNGDTNVILPAGNYCITFDPTTNTISLLTI